MTGEIEQSHIRNLTHVLGHDGDGLFGRESINDLLAGIRLNALGADLLFLGDSITHYANTSNGSYGYQNIAVVIAGRFQNRMAVEAGVLGNNSADVLARLDALIAAGGFSAAHVLAGTNDAGQGVPAATYVANMTAIFAKFKAAHIPVLVGTVPPCSGTADNLVVRRRLIQAYNLWLRRFAPSCGVVVVDYHAALVDPATGNYRATYVTGAEQIHPNDLGHFAMGETLAAKLREIRGAAVSFVNALSRSDAECIANPLMNGTPGVGNKPSGWYQQPSYPVGGGAVNTEVKVKSGSLAAGQWFEMSLDATNGDIQQNYGVSLDNTKYAVGDKLALTYRAEIDDIAGNLRDTSAALHLGAYSLNLNGGGVNVTPTIEGTFSSVIPPILNVYTATRTDYTLWFNGFARTAQTSPVTTAQKFKFRVGEAQVYNLTRLGLDGVIVA